VTGRCVLEAHAPSVVPALDAVLAIAPADLAHPAVRAFAEQVSLDVTLAGDLRPAFLAATGASAFEVVQRIWAHDVPPRALAVLDQLYGVSDPVRPVPSDTETWPLLEELMRAVARLDAVDPVTTELVRLRGAAAHDCRLCRSRRAVPARDAGSLLDLVEAGGLPDELTPTQRAALALTDAVMWEWRAVPEATLAAVRTELAEAEVVEVVLDVVRNAANKIAVALGADAPEVTEGVQWFRTDHDGQVLVE
jgi:alkylhydroperoxidase family enzyme